MKPEDITYCPRCEKAVKATQTICDHCGYETIESEKPTSVGQEMTHYRFIGQSHEQYLRQSNHAIGTL